ISKQSRKSALARPTTAAISVRASVLITSGRTPSSAACRLIWSTASCAFSTESTNGSVISVNPTSSNWVSRLGPSISAVMPVRSDTQKAARFCFIPVNIAGFSKPHKSRRPTAMEDAPLIVDLARVRASDVASVGGKNSSLGELISQLSGAGVRVPGGFATTADAFREFLGQNGLAGRVAQRLASLDANDVAALARAGQEIRGWLTAEPLPPRLEREITAAYDKLVDGAGDEASFAVRSSATAEDLPDASFAGQQETILNVRGRDHLLAAIKEVYASLYNDRAISYRVHQGYTHEAVALSVGVQRMVRSDLAASGVIFTLDTESGFDQV